MIELLIGIGYAAGAGALAFWWRQDARVRPWCGKIAAAALFIALTVVAGAIVRTILHRTVFMTEVHMVLLNPLFILCGAYLSFYLLASSLLASLGTERRSGIG
ncbi:hypothetical protein ACFSL6_05735 [Paenibacillus thailandensis]|jgi:hypothetical protein|uniref:Transposase n=1 Tax=Paenibacillus thailandensis TaxID=393250 RepID=A0ABW5QTE0_9BACL